MATAQLHTQGAIQPPAPPPTWQVRRVPGEAPRVEVTVVGVVPGDWEAVFAEMTDPARVAKHPGVVSLTVLQSSEQAPGGPGSMRRVVLPSGGYTEAVLSWDPPHRLEYDVVAETAPIDHHGGTLTFTPVPGGVAVRWCSSFTLLAGPLRGPIAEWMARRVAEDLAWHLEVVASTVQGRSPPPRHGLWLATVLVPVLLWNVAWVGELPATFRADTGVPAWLLGTESALRLALVAAILPARAHRHAPARAYVALWLGVALYIASWLPLLVVPGAAEHLVFAVAPALTPVCFIAPVAWLARSWLIGFIGAAFVAVHVAHQLW